MNPRVTGLAAVMPGWREGMSHSVLWWTRVVLIDRLGELHP